jgi:hypothetical protein
MIRHLLLSSVMNTDRLRPVFVVEVYGGSYEPILFFKVHGRGLWRLEVRESICGVGSASEPCDWPHYGVGDVLLRLKLLNKLIMRCIRRRKEGKLFVVVRFGGLGDVVEQVFVELESHLVCC